MIALLAFFIFRGKYLDWQNRTDAGWRSCDEIFGTDKLELRSFALGVKVLSDEEGR